MSASAFSIGDKVRVNSLHNRISKIAMIASYNSDFTYDVFYDTRTDDGRRESEAEEISVEPTRIAKLQPFEIVSLSQLSSSQKKDYGNIMFKLQDLDSATRYYKSALNSLLLNEKSKKTGTRELCSAIVSDVEDGLYDVIFDDERLGEEGMIDVSRLHVLAQGDCSHLANGPCTDGAQKATEGNPSGEGETNASLIGLESKVVLQRALYMNLARCYMRRVPHLTGWAVHMASLSLGISTYLITQLGENSLQSQGGECPLLQQEHFLPIDDVMNRNVRFTAVSTSHLSITDRGISDNRDRYRSDDDKCNIHYEAREPSILSYPIAYLLTSNVVSFIVTILVSVFRRLFVRRRGEQEIEHNSNDCDKKYHERLNLTIKQTNETANTDCSKNIPHVELSIEKSLLYKQVSDSLYLRSKAYLAASRPQLAKMDALCLSSLDSKKSSELFREIDAFVSKRKKSNRKLARDVAEWVDQAVRIAAESKERRGVNDTDLEIEIESDEDEVG